MSAEAVTDLKMERIKILIDQIKSAIPSLEELATATDDVKSSIEQQLANYALSLKTTKLKPEELESFFRKPYLIIPVPGKQDSWDLIIPRFIDMQVGWLKNQTESFNIFLINRYVEWLGGLPEEIKKQLGFKPGLNLELQGDTLVGPRQDIDKAWAKYRPLLKDHDGKKIIINQRRAFELLAALCKDGVLPFAMQPIPKEDLLDPPIEHDFTLRPYQQEAWETLVKFSHIGMFYPASVGKTFSGMDAMCKLRGPHLVPVPTKLLIEQWVDRIEAHTQLKPEDYIVCTYQMAIKKYANGHPDGREWGLLIPDEVHHMPSNLFSKMALIKRRQTLGLTASPSREDGREEYIFAFTGKPVGLGWQYFRELGIIKSPICHIWLLKNFEAKITRLKSLLKEEKKTLIFADRIEIGKTIAARFNLPHIYGETKQRLSTIQDALVSVVSRVADEGVSLPDIERVIEVSWLFGSRRQELQRFTRLLHGQSEEAEHHILMTVDEYLHDRKRLFSVMDKGFKLEIHREGVSEETITRRIEGPTPRMLKLPPSMRDNNRKQVEPQPVSTSPPDQVAIAGLFNLPGIKKIMANLPKPQQRLYELLLKNDGQWFKKSSLPLILGYTSLHSMEVNLDFAGMVKRGLIQQGKIERETAYRTNLRTRM